MDGPEISNWGMGVVVQLLAAAFLIAFFLHFVMPRSDFVIQVRDGQVQCKGKLPLSQRAAIVQFLLQDVMVHGPVKIMGAWHGKRLQLWFRGALAPRDQQRVRNFLLTRL